MNLLLSLQMLTVVLVGVVQVLQKLRITTTDIEQEWRQQQEILIYNNNKISGIDGDHPHTPCTLTDIPDYCKGYKKGYSDEVVDELD
jgi:hypothetical protein